MSNNLDRAIAAMEAATSVLLGAFDDANQKVVDGRDPAAHESRQLRKAVGLLEDAKAAANIAQSLAEITARELGASPP